ncbi:aspartic proteinase Asp1-like [Syzygium oleosum]|uniref:aspartic proteinase Asp1-like n=1 Tax=Syzygium oleosum TaxID=219896 RepID=UPI0024BB1559|nr:aspartic proteinase Asp1-like [Syzygium oleosum]
MVCWVFEVEVEAANRYAHHVILIPSSFFHSHSRPRTQLYNSTPSITTKLPHPPPPSSPPPPSFPKLETSISPPTPKTKTRIHRKMGSLGKSKKAMVTVLCWVLVSATLQGCSADVPHFWNNTPSRSGSSLVLPLAGKVYPDEYFSVSIDIGGKAFKMDIDTGSVLTWVECDLSCTGCTQDPEHLYKPHNNFVLRSDPLCAASPRSTNQRRRLPRDHCPYKVRYLEGSSSTGSLVSDSFSLKLRDGSTLKPRLTFGCAYEQNAGDTSPSTTNAGLLGLGKGKVGILSQLVSVNAIQNVLGHCLSAQGGGFLFLGGDLVPSSKIAWVPFSAGSLTKPYYEAGPAELLHNGKPTGVGGLQVVFDSGTSVNYFNTEAYAAVVDKVRADLKGKPLEKVDGHEGFPICWKGAKPFQNVNEVKNYFMPLALSFMKGNAQLQLLPEDYLIISNIGAACLGIYEVKKKGPREPSIIGDISMQDKMVIYDNEKKQIGWVSANCAMLPEP